MSNSSTVSGIGGTFPNIPHLATFKLTNAGARSLMPSIVYRFSFFDKSRIFNWGNELLDCTLPRSSTDDIPVDDALIALKVSGNLVNFNILVFPDTFKNNKFGGNE